MRPDSAVSKIHWVSAERGSRDLVTEMGNINCLAKCYIFSYQKGNHTSQLEHILALLFDKVSLERIIYGSLLAMAN